MRKDWMKRCAAWLLAALLAISPALAEPVDATDATAGTALAVEETVLEGDAADLGGDDPIQMAEEQAAEEEEPGDDAADDEIPVDDNNPTDDETPVDGDNTVDGNISADDETPVDGETPANDEIPASDDTPAEGEAPVSGENPADDETPVDDEAPSEPDIPTADGGETPVENVEDAQADAPAEDAQDTPVTDTEDVQADAPGTDAQDTPAEDAETAPIEDTQDETTDNDPITPEADTPDADIVAPVENTHDAETVEPAENAEETQNIEDAPVAAETPAEPEVTMPSEPAAEAPAEPETAISSEPEIKTSIEPEIETPAGAEPETATPSEPEPKTPSEPETEAPSKSETATPSEPATEASAEPAAEAPVEPAAEAPAEPATEAPAQPEVETAPVQEAGPGLALSAAALNLGVGEQCTLKVLSLPEGVSAVSFQSSDPGVADVTPDGGLITTHAIGSAVVTATAGDSQAACTVNVLNPPGNVSLSASKITLGVGQVQSLSALLPAGTGSQITWRSSKSAVAIVDEYGNVTACGQGTAKITGYTFNGKKAVCKVTVKPAPAWMTATLDANVYSVGQRRTLTIKASKGSKYSYTVTSSDPAVVSVEGDAITAAGVGAATVSVVAHNGLRVDLGLTVVPVAGSASLPAGEIALGKGEKLTLTPVYDVAAPMDVAWSSSKPKVVAVSAQGKLTAKRRGSAVITMTTHNGLTASCAVRVGNPPSKVKLSPSSLALGMNETARLTAKMPAGTLSSLTWTSSAPGVASVDTEGRVTAIAPGTANITVKTFNGKRASCKVIVGGTPTALAFTADVQTLGVGMTVDLKPVTDSGVSGGVTIASDNPGVVGVSGTNIVALSPGTATVTGTTYNGVTASVGVTVVPAPDAVGLSAARIYLGKNERYALAPATTPGSATTFKFKSSRKDVATVSADGVVQAKKKGTTTITVTTHNGLTARVKVTVAKAPSKVTLSPASVAMEYGETYQLSVKLPKGTASTVTFTSSNPAAVEVDASGMLYARGVGSAVVSAATYNNKLAYCQVTVVDNSGLSDDPGSGDTPSGTIALSNTGMVMLPLGGSWVLTATGNVQGVKWATSASEVVSINPSGSSCTVTAASAGTASVAAYLPNGDSASVIVMAVDVNDLSAANFNNVQKALLSHEELISSEAGGNVIWSMISNRLLGANFPSERVASMIASLKAADATYRNLYIYSFGTYDVQGESSGTSSYYSSSKNTIFARNSSQYTAENYAYMIFHETGHAIDQNADGNNKLNSLNDEAIAAVISDVRNLLAERIDAAISGAGVAAGSVRKSLVLDALMDYRVLKAKEETLNELGLTEDERKVYDELSNLMASEMNMTLPANNGCMVWDSVEGATNYAIHGMFGHYYQLKSSSAVTRNAGYNYYYNADNEPLISTEPWAEFFSSNIVGDATSLSLNWKYLPQTCKYFAEKLTPQLLNYFTDYIKSK